jgi:hypothetical protein
MQQQEITLNRSYDTGLSNPKKSKVTIDKILAFEELLKQQPQLDLKVINHFSHGVYARELLIPAGTILTGEIHKHSNLNLLMKGKIKVSIGDEIELIEAPFIVVSPPGTKRVAEALTECVWVTVHGTFETNINKIREYFIANSYMDWLEFSNQNQLELPLC